jgi:ubiquitin thioesterase protein OTUB1
VCLAILICNYWILCRSVVLACHSLVCSCSLILGLQLLGEQYDALRRTRGDGNCFYRSFMFSYLEHILETQDKAEVDRIMIKIEECKKTLLSLGYIEFTFEDFFSDWFGLL